MTGPVYQTNVANKQTPKTVQELVNFVEMIRSKKDRIFVQISGYGIEQVRQLAQHYGTNFIQWEGKNVDLNPFTIIYINLDGEVKSNSIDEKSKIVIYAKRPISNHL